MKEYVKVVLNEGEEIKKTNTLTNLKEVAYKYPVPNLAYEIKNQYIRCGNCGKSNIANFESGSFLNPIALNRDVFKEVYSKSKDLGDISLFYGVKALKFNRAHVCGDCGNIMTEDNTFYSEGLLEDPTNHINVGINTIYDFYNYAINKITYFENKLNNISGESNSFAISFFLINISRRLGGGNVKSIPMVNDHAFNVNISINPSKHAIYMTVKNGDSGRVICSTNIGNTSYAGYKQAGKYKVSNGNIDVSGLSFYKYLNYMDKKGYIPLELKEKLIDKLDMKGIIDPKKDTIVDIFMNVRLQKYKDQDNYKLIKKNRLILNLLVEDMLKSDNALTNTDGMINLCQRRKTVVHRHLDGNGFNNKTKKHLMELYFNAVLSLNTSYSEMYDVNDDIFPIKNLKEKFNNEEIQEFIINNPESIFGKSAFVLPFIKTNDAFIDALKLNIKDMRAVLKDDYSDFSYVNYCRSIFYKYSLHSYNIAEADKFEILKSVDDKEILRLRDFENVFSNERGVNRLLTKFNGDVAYHMMFLTTEFKKHNGEIVKFKMSDMLKNKDDKITAEDIILIGRLAEIFVNNTNYINSRVAQKSEDVKERHLDQVREDFKKFLYLVALSKNNKVEANIEETENFSFVSLNLYDAIILLGSMEDINITKLFSYNTELYEENLLVTAAIPKAGVSFKKEIKDTAMISISVLKNNSKISVEYIDQIKKGSYQHTMLYDVIKGLYIQYINNVGVYEKELENKININEEFDVNEFDINNLEKFLNKYKNKNKGSLCNNNINKDLLTISSDDLFIPF